MTSRAATRWSALLLLLIGLVLLHALWAGRGIAYSPDSDILSEHVGIASVERAGARAEGELPLWNPSMNSGAPALANPQAMYLFPFDLLFLALPVSTATNTVILLNFLLAGLAMLAFSRRHLRHPGAALLSAAAYMLSFRYLAMIYAGWLPKMSMYALAPLLFWAVDRLAERPTWRRTALAALVGALALLQGDMQQLYYAGLACAVWVLCLGVLRIRNSGSGKFGIFTGRSGRSGRKTLEPSDDSHPSEHSHTGMLPDLPDLPVKKNNSTTACKNFIPAFAIAALLAAMLAAPALLPEIQFARLSTRTEPSLAFLLQNSPTRADLLTFFGPQMRNALGGVRLEFWENNFYFGLWMAPLWIVALLGARRRPARLLALGIAACAFLSFDTPIVRSLYDHFPGFNLFRQPSRLLLLAQMFAALLAGLGADVLLGLRTFARPSRAAIAAGILLLGPIADAARFAGTLVATQPLSQVLLRHAFDGPLARDRNGGRVLALSLRDYPNIGRAALLYGTAGYYGIDLANGVASLELKHYIEYFTLMEKGSVADIPHRPVSWTDCSRIAKPELLRALDVRYVIGDPAADLSGLAAKKVWESRSTPVYLYFAGMYRVPIAVWRLDDPLGPGFFARSVRTVGGEEESLRLLAASTSARDALVFVRKGEAYEGPSAPPTAGFGSVSWLERGYNRYRYRVESPGRNFLILSQVWYPGWRATLDGAPLRLYRTNHALLGCVVPPGSHELVLKMTCPPLHTGIAAAGIAAIAAALMLAL